MGKEEMKKRDNGKKREREQDINQTCLFKIFIWLHQVLVAEDGILVLCGIWDLVP